jgi:hypothetical protein
LAKIKHRKPSHRRKRRKSQKFLHHEGHEEEQKYGLETGDMRLKAKDSMGKPEVSSLQPSVFLLTG